MFVVGASHESIALWLTGGLPPLAGSPFTAWLETGLGVREMMPCLVEGELEATLAPLVALESSSPHPPSSAASATNVPIRAKVSSVFKAKPSPKPAPSLQQAAPTICTGRQAKNAGAAHAGDGARTVPEEVPVLSFSELPAQDSPGAGAVASTDLTLMAPSSRPPDDSHLTRYF